MSQTKPLNARTLKHYKRSVDNLPLVCLTCYCARIAELIDPHADLLLVGDSLGMTLYGMDNTLGVTLAMMIAHGRAVASRASHAFVIVDMPFGSFQESPEKAYRNAARMLKQTGCGAVKLEGGAVMAGTVRYLTERGIPTVGHIGLLPQSVVQQGGYRYQGRSEKEREKLLEDAKALENAGAIALVIEGVDRDLAALITQSVAIPTIGIGASAACDGQVLVTDDLLGLTAAPPRFAKQYATLADVIRNAAGQFREEVSSGAFPGENHTVSLKR